MKKWFKINLLGFIWMGVWIYCLVHFWGNDLWWVFLIIGLKDFKFELTFEK